MTDVTNESCVHMLDTFARENIARSSRMYFRQETNAQFRGEKKCPVHCDCFIIVFRH